MRAAARHRDSERHMRSRPLVGGWWSTAGASLNTFQSYVDRGQRREPKTSNMGTTHRPSRESPRGCRSQFQGESSSCAEHPPELQSGRVIPAVPHTR